MAYMKRVDNTVPAGRYQCRFDGTEQVHHEEFGDRLRWTFIIANGTHEGKKVSGFTTTSPTTRNKCGDYMCALVGEEASGEFGCDPDEFIGHPYSVKVAESSTGKSVIVKDFEKLDEPKTPAQPIEIDPSETEPVGDEIPF